MATLSPERWKAVSPYLDQALLLPEEERAAWLDSLAGKDPQLASALKALLDSQRAAVLKHFLEQPPVPPEPSAAGQTIGYYTLLSPLGQGGMGTVWLAERSDGRFDRRVAIKFLRFSLASAGGAERFKREGRILAQLAHPHIAQLMDAGVTDKAEPYLVLEHVEGEPIDQYCDRHKLDVDARIRLFLDVLSAIAYAHASLIVHRDLKPSNVLVRNDGEVKLLDFGIAKLLGEEGGSAEATQLTLEGGAALTPQFAAPEQVTGAPVTTATDVYALGALLYLLLTGRHPAGDSTHSTAELVKAIIDTEPLRASEAVASSADSLSVAERRSTTSERLSRHLRGDLDTIFTKALKKNPTERYGSVAALTDDLRRYLKHEPISARPDSFTYRASRFVRRNSLSVALTSFALLALISGLIGVIVQSLNARRERDFALRQLERAESTNEFNQFLLSDALPSDKPFTGTDLLQQAEKILQRQTGNNSTRVELLISIGTQYSVLDNTEKADAILQHAYKLAQQISDPEIRASAACSLAFALERDGQIDRAETLFQEGMSQLPSGRQFALDRTTCLRYGSAVARDRGDSQAAIHRLEDALTWERQSPFKSDWSEMLTLMDLADAYRTANRTNEAIEIFSKVDALAVSLGRDRTQSAAVLYNDWALALERVGRPLEGEQLYRRVSEIYGGAMPPIVLNNYAKTLRLLGRLPEAAADAERAYLLAREGGNKFVIYQALFARALIYIDQHDFDRAANVLSDLEPKLQKVFSPDDMWFSAFTSARALVAAGRGEHARGLKLADDAIAIVQNAIKNKGQGTDYLPIVLLRRASVELSAGQPNRAEKDSHQALEILQASIRPGMPSCYMGEAHLILGKAMQAVNQPNQAHAAFRLAAEEFEKAIGLNSPNTRLARQLAGL